MFATTFFSKVEEMREIMECVDIQLSFHASSAGTCINNTSVFMFKKGCFELGATIYPVVIKVRAERGGILQIRAGATSAKHWLKGGSDEC